jgi:ribosomal protein S18 acetylase RimI-like enzyme
VTPVDVRRLAQGDEELVVALGRDRALSAEAAAALLHDPAVRYLVPLDDGETVGYAFAYLLRRRRQPERSLFLYDIEVDERFRRLGVGRRLMEALSSSFRHDR